MLPSNGTPQEAHADPVVLGYLTPPGISGMLSTFSRPLQCDEGPARRCGLGPVAWPVGSVSWPACCVGPVPIKQEGVIVPLVVAVDPVGDCCSSTPLVQVLLEEGQMEEESPERTRQERPVPAANGGRLCSWDAPPQRAQDGAVQRRRCPPSFSRRREGDARWTEAA